MTPRLFTLAAALLLAFDAPRAPTRSSCASSTTAATTWRWRTRRAASWRWRRT